MDSYFILFLSIAVSLITIFYYMRIVAYLFIGEDNQGKSTGPSTDAVAFDSITLFQGSISTVLIF
jgi:NADH:ubiquinone oxidoreductase subunit 2 (subunit N)